jgi:hypothetical protein
VKIIGEGPVSPVKSMDPRQVIISLISLCIFPFAAKPVLLDILFDGDNEAYMAAMLERKKIIPQLMKQLMSQNFSR